jgi:SAM-dependent methyltransferase
LTKLRIENPDPWTLYWQADCLDSCVATKTAQDAVAIRDYWSGLATQLNTGSRLLDLATGNGTVPAALLHANDSLKITGVDFADIDPMRFLTDSAGLAAVDFVPNTDICSMPYGDRDFDAVTSQFGIEYAPLDKAIPEAVRVLSSGGKLQLLMHHADSEIAVPARTKRQEMQALLKDGGVLKMLEDYVNGEQAEGAVDVAGQAHLASGVVRSKQVSGQIFAGVDRAITSFENGDHVSARALCETMLLRLGADRDRLQRLDDAAMDSGRFEDLIGLLESEGVKTLTAGVFTANTGEEDEFIIGWQYCGEKA